MTVSGKFFEILSSKPEQIGIEDIAHALSMMCRFAGHCRTFSSVAEHSCRVSDICSPEDRLAGLLDDAAKAYLCDMPRSAAGTSTANAVGDHRARSLRAPRVTTRIYLHHNVMTAPGPKLHQRLAA